MSVATKAQNVKALRDSTDTGMMDAVSRFARFNIRKPVEEG